MKQVDFSTSFPCEFCGKFLYVPKLYSYMHGVLALCLALLFARVLGFRQLGLLMLTLFLWIPMLVVDVMVLISAFPPKLKLLHLKKSPLSMME